MASQGVRGVGEKKNKPAAKDLINVGIFTALYFVIFFATGMIGYVPVLMLVVPFLCPLLAGTPFMLFLTRVSKFGMITTMGIILSVLMLVTGHSWPVIITGVVFSTLADAVMYSGKYHAWGRIRLGYIMFSQWFLGMLVPLFFMRDQFFAVTRDGYGDTYADTLARITPPWVFFAMIAAIAAGAFLGASLGRALLKKHFKRAGIA